MSLSVLVEKITSILRNQDLFKCEPIQDIFYELRKLFRLWGPHTHTRAVFISHERTTKTILDFREWLFTPTSGHEGHLLPSMTH